MNKKENKVNTFCSNFDLNKMGIGQKDVSFFDINLDKDNLAFFDYNRVVKDISSDLGKRLSDKLRVFLLGIMIQSIKANQKDGLRFLDGIAEINETR